MRGREKGELGEWVGERMSVEVLFPLINVFPFSQKVHIKAIVLVSE